MGLQTALRGLIAQQEALDTTGHNIANANTLGYSRQEVTTSASRALRINTGSSAGNGKAEPAPATASSTSSTAPRRCASAGLRPVCRGWKRSKARSPSPAKPGSRTS
jgi:flagellar hook protein FlgE